MNYKTRSYSLDFDIKENTYNFQRNVGDQITFHVLNDTRNYSGIILKKYTNSCLVDISMNCNLTEEEQRAFNGRIVISYKMIVQCSLKALFLNLLYKSY